MIILELFSKKTDDSLINTLVPVILIKSLPLFKIKKNLTHYKSFFFRTVKVLKSIKRCNS